jgi:hypothetical protein
LERASRALAEQTTVTPDHLADARRSVLQRALVTRRQIDRRRTVRIVAWAVPVAAMFSVAVAVAAIGGLMPKSKTSQSHPAPAVAPTSMPSIAHEGSRFVQPLPSAARESLAPSPSLSALPMPLPVAVGAPASRPATSASSDSHVLIEADLRAYRTAHTLHFVERNWRSALAAWDSYLANFAQGTFAMEAKYNRAICLVKLGQKQQARVALQPFADGRVGEGYRQSEARALLSALDDTGSTSANPK